MTGQPLRHFLLIFNHERGELLVEPRPFETAKPALEAYANAERQYDRESSVEVVLIGSDSLETIRRTHANFFAGKTAAEKLLSRI